MRIGIDCLRADPDYVGGLNTYILGLLDGFAACGRSHSFQLYLTEGNRSLFAKHGVSACFELITIPSGFFRMRQRIGRAVLFSRSQRLYRMANGRLFNSIREIMDSGSDLIYTPTVSLLCFNHRKPTLLSMHDIQHLHYPEFFSWPRLLSRKMAYELSAAHASYFQASSEFIKRDMLAHFPQISPQQIAVIRDGVNLEDFLMPRGARALQHYQLADRFLFLPAQLWPHKNHLTVLKALRRVEREHGVKIPLVMTGARYSAAPAVFRFVTEHRMDYVRHLGKVSFEDLVALYQRAGLVISAGFYEASSLPVLEAAAAGTAVVASKIPPNEELAQTLSLNFFDPSDDQGLAQLLFSMWKDENACRQQGLRNRNQVTRFSWMNAAGQYLDWIEQMGNGDFPARQLQTQQ